MSACGGAVVALSCICRNVGRSNVVPSMAEALITFYLINLSGWIQIIPPFTFSLLSLLPSTEEYALCSIFPYSLCADQTTRSF